MAPCDLTAVEARRRIDIGELTSTDLVASCLERIEAVDPAVNAMVTRAAERALDEATAADAVSDPRGPLHGLPVAIKDIVDIEGRVTTGGSALSCNDGIIGCVGEGALPA